MILAFRRDAELRNGIKSRRCVETPPRLFTGFDDVALPVKNHLVTSA